MLILYKLLISTRNVLLYYFDIKFCSAKRNNTFAGLPVEPVKPVEPVEPVENEMHSHFVFIQGNRLTGQRAKPLTM